MADGLNTIRAMRISELMTDYRNLHHYLASIRASPSAEEYNEEGFLLLRHCESEARALLAAPFQSSAGSAKSDDEAQKVQLRRILVDAAVRRHRAQRIYLRATAALRWVNSRAAVLQGQVAHAGHASALEQIRGALRAELAGITDQRVELSLRGADVREGKWLLEDPPLSVVQRLSCG